MTDRNCIAPDCERAWVAKGLCLKHYKASRRPKPLTGADLFWSKVTEDGSGCWIWTGPLQADGYGQTMVNRQKWLAHRFAFTHMVANIPDGLQIDHLCRVKSCVNPAHLEPVTPHVNNMRSESLAAKRARMTHCPRGHEFTAENTYRRPGTGGRMCRTCQQIRETRRERRGA